MRRASSQLTRKILDRTRNKRSDQSLGLFRNSKNLPYTYSLAKAPVIRVAKSITGPSRTSKLFHTFSRAMKREGRVTPLVRTWMESTSRVNYCRDEFISCVSQGVVRGCLNGEPGEDSFDGEGREDLPREGPLCSYHPRGRHPIHLVGS